MNSSSQNFLGKPKGLTTLISAGTTQTNIDLNGQVRESPSSALGRPDEITRIQSIIYGLNLKSPGIVHRPNAAWLYCGLRLGSYHGAPVTCEGVDSVQGSFYRTQVAIQADYCSVGCFK